jgi:FkbM family methyltransferase
MRDNFLKRLVRRICFPNGAVRKIAFGPLRGLRYRVSPITGMETWHSAHERPMQDAFDRLVKRGDYVVDVGTNWGGHALHMSRLVGPTGQVLAIEPSPGVAMEARWHFEANSGQNIRLLEVALADAEGTAYFEAANLSTTGHLSSETTGAPTDTKVVVTTLDSVVRQQGFNRLDLVKIDVEGAESRVLAGAKDTLKQHRPSLIVELHTPEQDLAVSAALRALEYRLRRLDGTLIAHPDRGWPDRDGVWGIVLATPH